MRKPFLLAAAVLALVSGGLRPPLAGAADSDEKLVQELRGIATDTRAHYSVRAAALDTLGKLGPKAAPAVPDLIKLLSDPGMRNEDDGRFLIGHVAGALGGIGPAARDAVPSLVKAKKGLPTPDDMIDMALKFVLVEPAGKPAPPEGKSVSALLRDLQDKDAKVRLAAAKALGTRAEDEASALELLRVALRDADPDVRRAAEQSAKKVREAANKATQEQVARLADILHDNDPAARVLAAKVLGMMGPSAAAALPALKDAASKDADADVKFVAKNAIDKIETKPAKE